MKKNKATQTSSPNPSPANNNKMAPRTQALVEHLLTGPRTVRELIDAIPVNNVPDLVMRTRRTYGVTIPCERVKFITADGLPGMYGIYHLTPSDAEKLQEVLDWQGAGAYA